MRCLLHIGTEKTGTTLLQDWLYANRAALSDRGVCLSDVLETTNNRKLAAYFQGYLDDYHQARTIADEAACAAFFEGFEAAFAREVAEARDRHHTMIITSEHFHSRVTDPQRVAALKRFLDGHFERIKVVCYFREQADMLQSLYSTAMRVSHTTSMTEFLRSIPDDYCDFDAIARRWSEAFGREHCDFRIYDRRAFEGGDLRKDFLGRLFEPMPAEGLDFAIDRSNESLSALELALYRRVNERVPYWNATAGGVDPRNLRLKAAISACEALRVGRLANTRRQEIQARFRDSNQRFSDAFFDGRALFDLSGNASTDSAAAAEPAAFSLEQVSEMLDALLTAVISDDGQDQAPGSEGERA